jgi:YegS/Rv2252/BmrU family lipid kinase
MLNPPFQHEASDHVGDCTVAREPTPNFQREGSPSDAGSAHTRRRRALLLINRRASRTGDCADSVAELLASHGIDILEDAPDGSETLAEVVVRHKQDVELVIVGGGDGTLNAAIEGLIDARLPVGILPLGTANDLARTLELPQDLRDACRIIGEGATRRVDVGQVNGKYFFNVASLGLSVDITRQLTSEVKRAWGVLAYLKTALAVLVRARLFHAEIECDAGTFSVKTVQIAVGNGRHYGGGMTVSHDATIDDSQLDLYSIEIDHWWQIVLLLPRLKTGLLASSRRVRTLRGKWFRIATRRPRSINTDGEITSGTPAEFRVVPAALSVYVRALR